jgi:hypothetical protein
MMRAFRTRRHASFPRGLTTIGETLSAAWYRRVDDCATGAPTHGHLECRVLAYFRPRPARRRVAPHLRLLFVRGDATNGNARDFV